jgi:molecular chaperone GrpE (heat shock protein)
MQNKGGLKEAVCSNIKREELVKSVQKVSNLDRNISNVQSQILAIFEDIENYTLRRLREVQTKKQALKNLCADKYKTNEGAATELIDLLS